MDERETIHKANEIAAQIGMMALLRTVIGHVFYTDDAAEFRSKMQGLENKTITFLGDHRHFPNANEVTETYIKEAACGWVSRCLAGIAHPNDQGPAQR
jgi:hypothetical protein